MLLLTVKMGEILNIEGVGQIRPIEKSGRVVKLGIDFTGQTQVVSIIKPGGAAQPVDIREGGESPHLSAVEQPGSS
ncbi:hypothetical protein [Ciceribacter sp. L1K22]|uniref:hypothetical protein n=1 Tax=Ciceribacter sp. L1K22 TaxID=2820275 RepID=UPI001ABEAAF9|nr:hypothetical protein [Ciceribacter sp. L1K22]MBO3760364.1 hypothetical protein [Ciceribacter sp. L1K22]